MKTKEQDLINRLQKNIDKKRSLVDEFYGELNDGQKEILVDENETKEDEPIDISLNDTATDLMWYDNWAEKWGDDNCKYKRFEDEDDSISLLDTPCEDKEINPINQLDVVLKFGMDSLLKYKNMPKEDEISDVNISFSDGCVDISFCVTPLYGDLYLNRFMANDSNCLGPIYIQYFDETTNTILRTKLDGDFYTTSLYFECNRTPDTIADESKNFHYYVAITNKTRENN